MLLEKKQRHLQLLLVQHLLQQARMNHGEVVPDAEADKQPQIQDTIGSEVSASTQTQRL